VGYSLRLPETWRDYDPVVEQALAGRRAEEISPCFKALLASLLGEDTAAFFSLLTFDEALTIPEQTALPAALAVAHAKAPAPLPITFLKSEFRRRMEAIEGVTVIETSNRAEINGMSAVEQTLSIDGLCDASGRAVPTTGFQIYLAEGSDLHILTFIAPNAVYDLYRAQFEIIAESFLLTQ
jgi:hypothetical protein